MRVSFEKQQEVLNGEFSIQRHKETFVNYLEVVIDPEGTVEYAVPSHQEKLIQTVMLKEDKTRDQVLEDCPREMWFDFIRWLCDVSGYIAVWNDHIALQGYVMAWRRDDLICAALE